MIKIERLWTMPNRDTFSIKPIGNLVQKYLKNSTISIDPFAGNNQWATYTNDLNPNTKADCHVYAVEFLQNLKTRGIKSDLIIFDPPYSLRQAKECYESFGKWVFEDTQHVGIWQTEKLLCNDLLLPGGFFLYFGWNTNGMGKKYGMEIVEILIVAHGRAHNDTLCLVEQKPKVVE